ncbi:fructose-bisphosphate aldolase 1 [Elsinoe australis]|uniref:Fructose-bisphosphate aldolase n=1 Tax=Elsinoe australis TaxID=40998 RepID=A0A2P7Z3Q4_9PEZI|nr:fructose-bisphosphate aldolase 1 [Elsinoe australis]
MTTPEDAARFVKETGVHFLAPSFGNVHGLYPPGGAETCWELDRLESIAKSVGPSIPLVLHGTHPVSDQLFQKAIKLGMRKINLNRSWSNGPDEGHSSQMPLYPGISRGGTIHLPSTVTQSGVNNPTTTTSNTLGLISESGSTDCSYQQHTQLPPDVQGNAQLATIQASANLAATSSRNVGDAIRLQVTST